MRYYGTDSGPACPERVPRSDGPCGSTVYGYDVEWDYDDDDNGRDYFIRVHCYGCGHGLLSPLTRCPALDTIALDLDRPIDLTSTMLRELHEAGRLAPKRAA